jgi:carbon monoxide dehydrogenase subunit G
MGLGNAKPSANYVPAYQSSGIPYVATAAAGETKTINLKKVTSEVTVSASGGTATVDFGNTGAAVFTVPDGAAVTFRIKTKYIQVISGGGTVTSVVAALTEIDGGQIPTYTQSDYGNTN